METIGEVRKNSKELIRISLGTYKGHPVTDIRCCYEAKPGEWLPGPKGVTFAISLLPEIIRLLQAAMNQAEITKGG